MYASQPNSQGNLKAVIFDWAGTTIDYGCFAPLAVFLKVFEKAGVPITEDEARQPMGMLKIDHIRALCAMERINRSWQQKYGAGPAEDDVARLYQTFETELFAILPDYTTPIPGVVELVERLRRQGLKIGSTTGYTADMMAIVAKEAKKQGYAPDFIATPNDVPAGRPSPFMCYLNAAKLGVYPLRAVVKVGDTVSDIREGRNAGMWSVGVIQGGSELGLTQAQVCAMDKTELSARSAAVSKKFLAAGANYVINTISDLEKVLDQIRACLEKGE